MLEGLIENKPATTKSSLRHHNVVVPHMDALQISEHQRRYLERHDLDVDALDVVNIAARSAVIPVTKMSVKGPMPTRTFPE
ncbi:hypothetical protein GN244_ATG12309 [Phytophthora infestans]|uniref:Uncharacterized protein n=1 Tax=Phytophthora infestans TaxID=4787 RepID=A0A833WAK3_PHYIN|nr:hypothetical protein GN244_ATG12309 [Phytophthora infestans]KAF4134614.1 hypothetical protein GN958_ATG16161 [Phytophthora infestans]KAF4150325.1 hypothetical protein GN958_ATG00533 [Phytophthora infestans]